MKKILIALPFLVLMFFVSNALAQKSNLLHKAYWDDGADTAFYGITQITSANMSTDDVNAKYSKNLRNQMIKRGKDLYKQWEVKADNSPFNQYVRGVYYFVLGLDTGKDEMFKKALPLLLEVNKLDKDDREELYESPNQFYSASRMIEFCKMPEKERISALKKIKKDLNIYFITN